MASLYETINATAKLLLFIKMSSWLFSGDGQVRIHSGQIKGDEPVLNNPPESTGINKNVLSSCISVGRCSNYPHSLPSMSDHTGRKQNSQIVIVKCQ